METQTLRQDERYGPSFICFLIWTFIIVTRPQDYMPFLAAIRPVLLISIITLIVMFFERTGSSADVIRTREMKLIIALYLIMLLGIPFSVHRGAALRFVIVVMPSAILFIIACMMQLTSLRRMNTTAAVIAVSMLFSASMYIVAALAHSGFRTQASQTYDPNDIAMIFATFIPMCLYILFGPYGFKMRIISIAAIILASAGIMLSGSRGGVLALAAVVLIFLVSRAPRVRVVARIAVAAILVLVFINYFGVVEGRFENFDNDYNFSDENGRINIWKQNLAILAQNPVLGTGAGCSTISLGLYRAQIGGSQAWQTTHSSVLQYAVDNGIPALILYIILNIMAIANVRRIKKDRDHPLSNIAFFVELSFYGFWAGGLLLSHAYSINLLLLIGFSVALRRLYEQGLFGKTQQITQ
jgi:O-antigen ligase